MEIVFVTLIPPVRARGLSGTNEREKEVVRELIGPPAFLKGSQPCCVHANPGRKLLDAQARVDPMTAYILACRERVVLMIWYLLCGHGTGYAST